MGDGAGVLVRNARGAKVTNGTVRGFDGGVVIENGGGNGVTHVTARDNIGQHAAQFASVTRYGDGIAVLGSSDNHLAGTPAVNTGRSPASACTSGPTATTPTPPLRPSGTGEGQRGRGGRLLGAVAADGIRVFGSRNTIHRYESTGNAAAGISVGRRTGAPMGSFPVSPATGIRRGTLNVIMRNVALDNLRFDLWDANPCGLNSWKPTPSGPVPTASSDPHPTAALKA